MKNILLLCFFLVVSCFPILVFAQDDTEDEEETTEAVDTKSQPTKNKNEMADVPLKDRIIFGGDFGLSFGQNSTYINVAPLIGYKVNQKFTVGGGFSYLYISGRSTDPRLPVIGTYQVYGIRAYARQFVTNDFFFHAEAEYLNVGYLNLNSYTTDIKRAWLPALWIGGGYSIKIGERSAFMIYAAYNLLNNYQIQKSDGIVRSPYISPVTVRTGFTF